MKGSVEQCRSAPPIKGHWCPPRTPGFRSRATRSYGLRAVSRKGGGRPAASVPTCTVSFSSSTESTNISPRSCVPPFLGLCVDLGREGVCVWIYGLIITVNFSKVNSKITFSPIDRLGSKVFLFKTLGVDSCVFLIFTTRVGLKPRLNGVKVIRFEQSRKF